MAKANRTGRNVRAVDRLSSLPDPILCHILSFLPTKCAVATSVLRRRWRSLWANVPVLHFDAVDHRIMPGRIYRGKDGKCLADIVNRVLLIHNARLLDTFFLSSEEEPINEHQFEAWISAVVTRIIRDIEIGFHDMPAHVRLPHSLFTCKTLVDLKLHRFVTVPADRSVRLPSLKKLFLDFVNYENDKSLPQMLSGCLVLEELIVQRDYIDGMLCCDIYSSTLKKLFLIFEFEDSSYHYNGYRATINTPALQVLVVYDIMGLQISAGPLSHLIEADSNLMGTNVGDDIDDFCLSVIKLVNVLEKLEFLKLKIDVQFFDCASSVTVRLHNLKTLDLRANPRILVNLLELADNLEDLVIRKVWIYGVEGKEDELEMLRYILWNGKVLETMVIFPACCLTDLDSKNIVEKISLFPRGSEACELFFDPDCWGAALSFLSLGS